MFASFTFQQSPATSVHDLVVTAMAADGLSAIRLEIAVRRAPKFIRSDKKTNEWIALLVRADVVAERASDPQLTPAPGARSPVQREGPD